METECAQYIEHAPHIANVPTAWAESRPPREISSVPAVCRPSIRGVDPRHLPPRAATIPSRNQPAFAGLEYFEAHGGPEAQHMIDEAARTGSFIVHGTTQRAPMLSASSPASDTSKLPWPLIGNSATVTL